MKKRRPNLVRGIAMLLERHPSREWARLADLLENSSRGREKESVERLDLELSRRSISELRELANQQGLSFSVKDSKQRLINRILKASPKAPLKIERNSKIRRHDEGDYAQWAEIIMGANKKKP